MPTAFLWITNITKKDIHVSDLGFTIRSFSSMEILANTKLHLSWEQIRKSIEEGCIFRKPGIIVRREAPQGLERPRMQVSENFLPDKARSILENQEEKYEELELSDEEFFEQIQPEENT